MADRIDWDPDFEQALLRSAELVPVLQDAVDRVAARASRLAPDDPRTGGKDLHTSIEGEVGMTAAGYVGRVNAMDFKAGWYEKGTSRQAARPYLAPAAEAEVGPLEAAPEV